MKCVYCNTVSRQIVTCTEQGKAWTGERRRSA